jgi:tetratricopeptide (TPR) repeat protein
MYTVFRIGEIKPLDNDNKSRFWHVHLTSTNADDEQLHQLTEHMRMELSSLLDSELQINMDPTWRLSKLLVHMGEYDKAVVIYEMMLDKAIGENNLKLVQATHYQMAEFFMIYKNDWDQAAAHLKKMFCIKIHDGDAVVDEAKDNMINIYLTIKDLLSSEQIDEDEFHSIMAELLNKLVTLYLNYSAKPLGPPDYQLLVDRYNYIGWIRKKEKKCRKHGLIMNEH